MNMSNKLDKELTEMSEINDVLNDERVTAVDEATQEYIVAVGLPKGLIYQAYSKKTTGVLRVGGEFVELTPSAYALWTRCLTPVIVEENAIQRLSADLGRFPQSCQSALDELFASRFLARLQLGSRLSQDISDLIPIPCGYGSGNSFLTPDKYYVSSNADMPVVLDVMGQALWSLMDGSLTLWEIAAEATKWLEVAPELVEMGLIYTTVELMNGRCLYLDRSERASRGRY